MKRNLYNLKIRKGGAGIGIGGIGIGIGGIGIGLGDELDTIIPEGYQFYNMQLDRIYYFLKCSGGDNLTGQDYTSGDGYYLRAQNIE